MLSFPLYDKLAQAAQYIQVNPEYDKMVTLTINNFNKVEAKNIYGLILHHANITGSLNQEGPSYFGKDNKKSKGIIYHFKDLPQDLRCIIILYVICLTM